MQVCGCVYGCAVVSTGVSLCSVSTGASCAGVSMCRCVYSCALVQECACLGRGHFRSLK